MSDYCSGAFSGPVHWTLRTTSLGLGFGFGLANAPDLYCFCSYVYTYSSALFTHLKLESPRFDSNTSGCNWQRMYNSQQQKVVLSWNEELYTM